MSDHAILAVMSEPQASMELREVPLPDPSPGEVLVEVVQSNVCGSDLHLWRGEMAPGFPRDVVLGHEMAGRVVALGEGASKDTNGVPLAEGDWLAYRYWEPCMHCPSCARGFYHHCASSLLSVLRPASQPPYLVGGFATHYLVTANRSRFKLPEGLSPQVAASANCAGAQVLQGLREARLTSGETVVVQGCGGLGLLAIMTAKAMGAGSVFAIDRVPARLDLAKRFGADEVVDASGIEDPKERTRAVVSLTGGAGADVVVEVVGRASVIPEGLRMLARGGRYLEMGSIVPRDKASLDASMLVGANQSIVGVSLYPDRALLDSLWLMSRSKAPLEELVGATFPLTKVDEALQAADALAKEGVSVGRVGIRPEC
jgi:threonine dehydrogenase-like Zn-dependent dehydrogenase